MHTLQQHLDSATITANVEALLPEIEQRGPEIAAARRLPQDLVASLKTAGAFRIAMPHEWGGPEMSMPDQLRLFERLAHADPAVAWCVMIGCDAGYFSSFLDDAAGRTLWPDLDMVTAGWVTPAGHARRVDGGYLVDGRWSFGSGCTHADVIIGGCLVFNTRGRTRNRRRRAADDAHHRSHRRTASRSSTPGTPPGSPAAAATTTPANTSSFPMSTPSLSAIPSDGPGRCTASPVPSPRSSTVPCSVSPGGRSTR